MKGISPVIATVLMLVVTLGLIALVYGYITGLFEAAPEDECDKLASLLEENMTADEITCSMSEWTVPKHCYCDFCNITKIDGFYQKECETGVWEIDEAYFLEDWRCIEWKNETINECYSRCKYPNAQYCYDVICGGNIVAYDNSTGLPIVEVCVLEGRNCEKRIHTIEKNGERCFVDIFGSNEEYQRSINFCLDMLGDNVKMNRVEICEETRPMGN